MNELENTSQQSQLRVGEQEFRLDERKQREDDEPVNVVDKVDQSEHSENAGLLCAVSHPDSFYRVPARLEPCGRYFRNLARFDSRHLQVTSRPPLRASGQLTRVTDPRGNQTNITYTTAGLIATVTDPDNQVTSFEYDARGNRTAVVDALNNRTTFTYNSMNRLTRITYPDLTHSDFAYDNRGRRTSVTDQNGKVTSYAYDDADRLTTVTDAQTPSAGVTRYAYDSENNLTSITDALGRATSFTYDSYGRVTKTTFPSTLEETYTYDAVGNLLSKQDRKNQTINYFYDALNRLTSKSYPDSASVTYTYDAGSRLTQVSDPAGTYQFAYDNLGRLTGTTTDYSFLTSRTFTNGYQYDAASNRTRFTDPEGGQTDYVYDALNRLTSLTNFSAQTFNFSYDALGRRTQLTRPNGVNTDYTYDNLSRLLSVLHKLGAQTIDGATYSVDAVGNRTSKLNHINSITETYSYDAIYQLTQVVQDGTTTTEAYSYDKVGNRLSTVSDSGWTYNNSNQLVSRPGVTYSYDHNGNTLTKTDASGSTQYAWDYENRLTSVTLPNQSVVSFKYDPMGRRIQKASASGTINYAYDGADSVEEVDTTGVVLARYAMGPSIDQPLSMLRSGATNYYEADGLGSVNSMTDGAGSAVASYVFDSFGKQMSPGGGVTNAFRYTAREFDPETGLYYYRARYYDAGAGRFITEDPIQLLGGMNFSRYVSNNPVNLVDPTGLTTEVILWNPVGHGESSFGHVSVVINGTSYSWGPGPGGSVANKCCKPGKMDRKPASDFIAANTKFRSGLGYVLNLTVDQEKALANYLSNFKGNYNVIYRNCGDPLVSGLGAIGIRLVYAVDPLTGLPPITLLPDDLHFAFGHTNGLVTGWVPHPQVSSK